MADSIALGHVLGSLEKLDVKDINLVCDRGFYSEANLRNIAEKGQKFTIHVSSSLKWQKELIDMVRPSLQLTLLPTS